MNKIHNGIIDVEKRNSLKDSGLNNFDLGTTKMYRGVKPMFEQLGFTSPNFNNPSQQVYWNNIIPTDFDYFVTANVSPFGLGGVGSNTGGPVSYSGLNFITYPNTSGPTQYQADVITPVPAGPYTGINPVTFDVTFYWRDNAGQVLYQETKSTSLNLVFGCTNPNSISESSMVGAA